MLVTVTPQNDAPVVVQPIADQSHALAVLQKGVGLWEQLVEAHPTVAGFQSDLSKFYDLMKNQQRVLGQPEDALRSMRKVRDIREKLVRAEQSKTTEQIYIFPVTAEDSQAKQADEPNNSP